MGKIFTYARVSTTDQNIESQNEILKKAYPDSRHYEEKQSGTSRKNRTELEAILKAIGDGDKLVVWKLDRLARSMSDLSDIMKLLKEKGGSLEILQQKIDTSTASGKAFLNMLGVFAEFETDLRRERQLAGIAKAKKEGKYKGKQANKEKHAKVIELLEKGYKVSEIEKLADMKRSSIYNIRKTLIKTER